MASTLSERREFYADIVTSAVEGGIGYWSAAEVYKWFDPKLDGGTAEPGPQGTANAYAIIVPADEEAATAEWPKYDGECPSALVDVDLVRRAVGKIVRGQLSHELRDDLVTSIRTGYRAFDASHVDAEAADVIVQVGVFGEVVFS